MKPFFFIFLIIIINQTNQAVIYYGRYTHLTHVTGGSPINNYHQEKILWGNNANNPGAEPSGVWTYSILRNYDNSASPPNVAETTKLNGANYDTIYGPFIVTPFADSTLFYVAWNFTYSCASSITTITYNIKFFDCQNAYDNFIYDITWYLGITDYLAVSPGPNIDNSFQVSGFDVNLFLGDFTTAGAFINSC